MNRKLNHLKAIVVALGLLFIVSSAKGQTGFDNPTRALYIFDLARYIDYGASFKDSSSFKFCILVGDYDLVEEMANLAKTRNRVQDKPVSVGGIKNLDRLPHCQVLYVNKSAGFDLDKIKEKIAGQHTMLITEGYEFRQSMINFIVVDGKPRYDLNEEYVKQEGMALPPTLLFSAIKTKEDWQNLFDIASKQIEEQKKTIQEQLETIDIQKKEIAKQKALLDSLDAQIIEKEKALAEKQKVLNYQMAQISKQRGEITVQNNTIFVQKDSITRQLASIRVQQDTLAVQKSKIEIQLKKISDQEGRIKIQVATLEKQKIIIYFIIFALVLASFLAYYIYRGYMIKKEANIKLEEKNRLISAQKDEIEKQRDIAAAQRDQIAYQKKHITDSIMYAKRIQTALIPSLELFSDKLEHFVLYKPLAIVSGDFYWVTSKDNIQVIIAADCTGHGVPGAFMSMLGVTLLNEIVNEKNIIMPDQIIENLRQGVIKSLKQVMDEDTVKDGMDIAVLTIDFAQNILWYAGGNNPLYLVRGGELIHYRPDKMPVAIHYKMQPFTNNRIEIRKGDSFYIFSDGYCDQFGGPNEKKFMSAKLRETLLQISGQPMLEQGKVLDKVFEDWKGENPQVDDVTLIGVRY